LSVAANQWAGAICNRIYTLVVVLSAGNLLAETIFASSLQF